MDDDVQTAHNALLMSVVETINALFDAIGKASYEYERSMFTHMLEVSYLEYDILIKHSTMRPYYRKESE